MLIQTALLLALLNMIIARDMEKMENLETSLAQRRIQSVHCQDTEYAYNGRCCLLCPAGTRVLRHCRQDGTLGHCAPCTPGRNFTAGPNGMETCVRCRPCRADDQIQVSECTATADYKCECKPNTYCSEGCDILCTKCSRCPSGHHVLYPCTPTSDTVCEEDGVTDPTTSQTLETPRSSEGDKLALAVLSPILSVSFVTIIILILIMWKKKEKDKEKERNGTNTELQTELMDGPVRGPSASSAPEEQRMLSGPDQPAMEETVNCRAINDVANLHDDTDIQEHHQASPQRRSSKQYQREAEQPGRCQCGAQEEISAGKGSREEGRGGRAAGGTACRKRLSDDDWLECYNCLREHVLPDKWKELMRNLRLAETEIQSAHMDYSHIHEINYQMLLKWRQQEGHRATMEEVLQALDKMKMSGCGEKIVSSLASKGIHITMSL